MIASQALTGEPAYIMAWFDNSRTDLQKEFRCNTCGYLFFQYWDTLKSIIPGRIDDGTNYQAIMCKGNARLTNSFGQRFTANCKAIYWVYR